MNTIKFNQVYREARSLMPFQTFDDMAYAEAVVLQLLPHANTGRKLYKLLTIASLGSKQRRMVQARLKNMSVRII